MRTPRFLIPQPYISSWVTYKHQPEQPYRLTPIIVNLAGCSQIRPHFVGSSRIRYGYFLKHPALMSPPFTGLHFAGVPRFGLPPPDTTLVTAYAKDSRGTCDSFKTSVIGA